MNIHKFVLNMLECDPEDHKQKLQAPYRSISRKELITWYEMCSHTIALFGNEALSDSQNLQKVVNNIDIFNGIVLNNASHS